MKTVFELPPELVDYTDILHEIAAFSRKLAKIEDGAIRNSLRMTCAAELLHFVPKDLRESFCERYNSLHDEVVEECGE